MGKQYKNIKKLLFLALLAPYILYAPPLPYQALAAFAGAAKQGAKPKISSLAAGKAYLDTMKNLYKFGPSSSPTTELLRNQRVGLFNVHTTAFRTSQNPANPTYVLGGRLAGKVIGGLTTQEIFTKAGAQGLSEFWRKQFREQFPKDKLSQQRVNEFIDTLKRSYEETHSPSSLFIPELTEISLFSHQALREQPITELVEMYKELADAGIVDFSTIDPTRLYDQAQFQEFKQKIDTLVPAKQAQVIIENPELASATEAYLKENNAELPPAPKQGSFCYQGAGSTPNCVETGLHDLVNILVFDPETRTFNPQKMLPENLSLNPKLLEFYQKYTKANESNINNSRQDWFNLMSGIPGVAYNRQQHELFPFFENQVKVLNFLFGTSARTLEEFDNLLSNSARKVSFIPLKNEEENNKTYGTYDIIIGNITGLKLNAHTGHGYLQRPLSQGSNKNLFSSQIANILIKNEQSAPFLPFIAPYIKTPMLSVDENRSYILSQLGRDITNPNQLLSFIKTLETISVSAKSNKKRNALDELIRNLLPNLPHDDEHFQREVTRITTYLDMEDVLIKNQKSSQILELIMPAIEAVMPTIGRELTPYADPAYILANFAQRYLATPLELSNFIDKIRQLFSTARTTEDKNALISLLLDICEKLPPDKNLQADAIRIVYSLLDNLKKKYNPLLYERVLNIAKGLPDVFIENYRPISAITKGPNGRVLPFSFMKEMINKSRFAEPKTREDEIIKSNVLYNLFSYDFLLKVINNPQFENDYLLALFDINQPATPLSAMHPLKRKIAINNIVNKVKGLPKELIKPYLRIEYSRIQKWNYLKDATPDEIEKILHANKERAKKLFRLDHNSALKFTHKFNDLVFALESPLGYDYIFEDQAGS